MTVFVLHPRPENSEKGEKASEGSGDAPFSPLSAFSGPREAANDAPANAYAAALAAVRSYRRVPPPEPSKPTRQPRRQRIAADSAGAEPALTGVPPDWCEGVARLGTMPAPQAITPHRWAAFTATSARLLHSHGAALHGAGWDTLDLFGLHTIAPAANPVGWGLAWLLGEHGDVLDVGTDAIGLRRGPDGARLAYQRRGEACRASVTPAWAL